jgi:hypothetical protein
MIVTFPCEPYAFENIWPFVLRPTMNAWPAPSFARPRIVRLIFSLIFPPLTVCVARVRAGDPERNSPFRIIDMGLHGKNKSILCPLTARSPFPHRRDVSFSPPADRHS